MKRLITDCPSCHHKMQIASLICSDCGLELHSSFEPSPFDQLSDEQYTFLMSFLQNRGSLKGLQNQLNISYPYAKRELDELLKSLGIENGNETTENQEGVNNMVIDCTSSKASEIIKAKLKEAGGHVVVQTLSGLPCEITACPDGLSFVSDKLPIQPPFRYEVFDVVVDLLLANGGRARKGNGRNYKLGHPNCDGSTVVGAIAIVYSGKKTGDSVFDPVFVLAAVLEWAGIAMNARGELVLTESYRSRL